MLGSFVDGRTVWWILHPPFQGYRGGTQGNLPPPTVFNMVLNYVIQNWVMVVALTEAGAEGIRDIIQELAVFFHADYGLVAPPQPERLQRVFNVLIDLFERVSLRTNVRKLSSMELLTCYIPGRLSELEYMQ